MVRTLSGISIDVKLLHDRKAHSPMVRTLSGISIDVKPVQ